MLTRWSWISDGDSMSLESEVCRSHAGYLKDIYVLQAGDCVQHVRVDDPQLTISVEAYVLLLPYLAALK